MKPTKKQLAMAVAALLTAVAGVLSQCPDEPAPRQGVTGGADAGVR
jgi:hypothetical protein